jgi:hypothetical protein
MAWGFGVFGVGRIFFEGSWFWDAIGRVVVLPMAEIV